MILALFPDEAGLVGALRRFRAADLGPIETHTPAPIADESTASPIPVIILLAGLCGAGASFVLQAWSSMRAYRFDIGGRPQLAWPSFIPTVFENAVLVAIAAGFLAYFIINRMPRLYDPVDEAPIMREASRDGWVLAVRSTDAGVIRRARDLLAELHPARIDEVPG